MRAQESDPDIGKPCTQCPSDSMLTSPPEPSMYRCLDCFNPPVMCKGCLLNTHRWVPLHRVQHWNGRFFDSITLQSLGLVVSLGHRGQPCPNAEREGKDGSLKTSKITVTHTTGLQDIAVSYCKCSVVQFGFPEPEERPLQLWRVGLWPATYARPKSVFSIHALRQFEQLTLQSKTTAHDYMGFLRRLTNNAFFEDVHNRYREFMTASRQYEFLHSLIRAAEDVSFKMAEGCLAVLCPACPQPEINMDPNWKSRPEEEQYIDALHYGKDGFFQANQHNKKMDHEDPSLTDGAAYFVRNAEYMQYLETMEQFPDAQEETSICSKFAALADKYSGKLRSGILSLTCTRHEFALPCGTVDLFKGERYVNVDYATVMGLKQFLGLLIAIGSYDIHCQYLINWFKRLLRMIERKIPGVSRIWPIIRRCVPKFHLPAHVGSCRWLNSFNFMPGVGMTDGEAVERRWSTLHALARSTREMGPGFRQDTWNQHTSDHNIQKTFRIAGSLAGKLKKAISALAEKEEELRECEQTLVLNGRPLDEWKRQEAEFLHNILQPNARELVPKSPYEENGVKAPTMKEIVGDLERRHCKTPRLSKKRKRIQDDSESDEDYIPEDNVQQDEQTRIMAGIKVALDLELEQIEVRAMVKNCQADNDQATSKVESRRRKLKVTIKGWKNTWCKSVLAPILEAIQDEALPKIKVIPDNESRSRPQCNPEDEVLPIPSSWPRRTIDYAELTPFINAEKTLRYGQANTTLDELRRNISMCRYLWKQIEGQVGQAVKTRNQEAVAGVQRSIDNSRETYVRIRKKLLSLGEPETSRNYRPLTKEDCLPGGCIMRKTSQECKTTRSRGFGEMGMSMKTHLSGRQKVNVSGGSDSVRKSLAGGKSSI
ncbi:hypothetical protein K474DRAFT_1736809 [Panus rudis PR-1116 ss-1]|nr:hypothetical protein K474DRAFT_1736809 [Panus rudis PR-1116 ss-1]